MRIHLGLCLLVMISCTPEALDRPVRGPVDVGMDMRADLPREDMSTTDTSQDMPVVAPDVPQDMPAAGPENVFEEQGGLVAVEAEHFVSNDAGGAPRAWYLTDGATTPDVTPDPDPTHVTGASGGGYLEGLPDTKVTTEDPTMEGESIYDMAGTGPTLTYKIFFSTPGTYHVHVRGYAGGNEDNSIHVGVDGVFGDSGYRLQWCDADFGSWAWSKTRDCAMAAPATLEISSAGMHDIELSMREDGAEVDKILLTTDAGYVPQGEGPAERPYRP